MKTAPQSGQIALVLTFMLLGLVFLTLVSVDTFLASHRKNRLQNAGDAAALAAARWQGITLNAIGALNLAKIEALCVAGDPDFNPVQHRAAKETCTRITALQQRLAFAGPLMGFYAAQRAVVKNGIETPDPDMEALVAECITRAAMIPSTELWPFKAQDYATMLHGAAADGVYAGADNAQFFNFAISSNHPLYNKAFYAAVDGSDWCWFYLHYGMYDFLKHFSGWGSIPEGGIGSPENSEFFGVDVTTTYGSLACLTDNWREQAVINAVLELAERNGCKGVTEFSLRQCKVINDVSLSWMVYNGEWHKWDRLHQSNEARLPIVSDVKDKFNVQGAFAATRVYQYLDPLTPSVGRRRNVWTAAAKPFGSINERTVTWDGEFPLVTPAFTDVRLVMLAAFSESRLGMADRQWVAHTRDHIEPPSSVKHVDGCRYCAILKKWEDPDFRKAGMEWLDKNGDEQCRRPTGGGSMPKGGTRLAH